MSFLDLSPVKLIAFDADDTLWVNEPLFVEVEKKLHQLLAHYATEETIAQQLYAVEMRNLDLFGYGAKGFMLSMIETAIELTNGKITGAEIGQIIEMGKTLLNFPIELLEGVEETLKTLSEREYTLMVLTKGDLFDQESKLARSELGDYFHHIEIVSEKNPATYQKLLRKYDLQPQEFLMLGNSLKSDILPVVQIGAAAIHIPYHTTWAHEQIQEDQLTRKTYLQVTAMSDILPLLAKTSG